MRAKKSTINVAKVVSHSDISKLAYFKSMTNSKTAEQNWLDAEKELKGK